MYAKYMQSIHTTLKLFFPHLCLSWWIAEPEVLPVLLRIAVSLLTEIILATVYRNRIRFAKSRNAIGPQKQARVASDSAQNPTNLYLKNCFKRLFKTAHKILTFHAQNMINSISLFVDGISNFVFQKLEIFLFPIFILC